MLIANLSFDKSLNRFFAPLIDGKRRETGRICSADTRSRARKARAGAVWRFSGYRVSALSYMSSVTKHTGSTLNQSRIFLQMDPTMGCCSYPRSRLTSPGTNTQLMDLSSHDLHLHWVFLVHRIDCLGCYFYVWPIRATTNILGSESFRLQRQGRGRCGSAIFLQLHCCHYRNPCHLADLIITVLEGTWCF